MAIVLADGPLPGVDTAERDDVVVEDDGTRLPDVDTAERDDVVPEDDGAALPEPSMRIAERGSRMWTRPSATTWLRRRRRFRSRR